MNSIKDNPNLPLFTTIAITLLLLIIGIVVLSKTEKKTVTPEERDSLLVKDDSTSTGPAGAKVTLVEFSDFQCPACAYYSTEVEKVKQTYTDSLNIVYRYFPLTSIHPLAINSALAAEAANAQGKFWDYYTVLFAKQSEWTNLSEEDANKKFIEYAEEVGVEDIDKFTQDLENKTYLDKINRDKSDAESLNLRGTPTIFIDGEQVDQPTYDNLSKIIEEELKK